MNRLTNKQTFGPEKSWRWQRDARGRTCGYASLDQISVPQQGPGGGKAEGRMAAVALIYNPQSAHDEKLSRGQADVRYSSGFYDLDDLGRLLRRQAAQVGWDELEQQLAVSDGGSGLEDFQRKNFPKTERILDFFHASEHVGQMAQAVCAGDPGGAAQQTADWCHLLKHSGGPVLRAQWEQLNTGDWSDVRREVYRQELQYFRNHEHKMDYPRYLANGWQIGSGAVESGCKRVVTQRLKGAGMRWGERGSNALCNLHALPLSQAGCWDDYWSANRHLQN